MTRAAIIVDSTAYIPTDKIQQYDNVFSIDLKTVLTDGTEVADSISGADLDAYLAYLEMTSTLPTTSQPSVGEYTALVEAIIAQGFDTIFAVHLSSGISGTYQNAERILNEYSDRVNIYCLDSKGASVIEQVMVEWIIQDLAEGVDPEIIYDRMHWVADHSQIYLMVEDLRNLTKGGRLSAAAARIGQVLQIRPLLHFNDEGKIELYEKLRTQRKVYQRWTHIVDQALEAYPEGIIVRMAYTGDPTEMQQVQADFMKKYPQLSIELTYMGPVVATHTGTGAKGIGIIPKPPHS